MKYFAYGSDLSLRQMQRVCPQAKRLYSARLPNWTLIFAGGSRTMGGGTATIRLQHGEQVVVGVYEIDAACLRALDRYEGYPTEYDRMNVIVFNDFGDAVEAVTYYRKGRHPENTPSREHLAAIREGYRDWGLV